jgi:hypothetical protein
LAIVADSTIAIAPDMPAIVTSHRLAKEVGIDRRERDQVVADPMSGASEFYLAAFMLPAPIVADMRNSYHRVT